MNSSLREKVPSKTGSSTQRGFILLVENEDDFRTDAAKALGEAGYGVIPCETTTEALRVIDEQLDGIHILVSRLRMPPGHIHGLALSRMVRYRSESVRIVLYTAGLDELPAHIGAIPGSIVHRPRNGAALVAVVKSASGS